MSAQGIPSPVPVEALVVGDMSAQGNALSRFSPWANEALRSQGNGMTNGEHLENVANLLKICQNKPSLFNKLFLERPAYWSRQWICADRSSSTAPRSCIPATWSARTTGSRESSSGGCSRGRTRSASSRGRRRRRWQCDLQGDQTMPRWGRHPVRGQAFQRPQGQPGGDRDRSRLASPGVQYNERGAIVGAACQASADRG